MFDIDELLSEENVENALESFRSKRDGAGPDGLRVSELDSYWRANHDLISQQIREGTYSPGVVRCYEVSTKSGKQREIANINVLDRFIEKLIQLKLRQYIEPQFLPHSYAYQDGKGILDAAMLIRDFVLDGKPYLCELDIKDYFGSIHLGRLKKIVAKELPPDVTSLIERILSREVEREGKIIRLEKGVLQGSPMSPALANLYLHAFDQSMEEQGLSWMRFSDNIYVCCVDS
jgi:retron-type reverse transcriptase